MIALYLDENVPPLVANVLRDERLDVVSAYEVEMVGKDDEEQLRYAASSGNPDTIISGGGPSCDKV